MKLNAAQILSILIVTLMASSMIAVMFMQSRAEAEPAPEEPPPIGEQIASFVSEPVEASVKEIFPSMTITAQTRETEIGLIDAQIYALEGIKRVKSFYQAEPATELTSGLTYVANISFEADKPREKILEELQEKATKLENVQAFSSALIQLPQRIILKKEEDENIFKDYTFEEPFSSGYISLETLKGDRIKVIVQTVFNGEQLMKVLAFETENISAAPVQAELKEKKTIAELKKKLRLSAKKTYTGELLEELNEEINALESVEKAEIEIMPVYYRLDLTFDANLTQEQWTDLNTSFSELEGITGFNFLKEAQRAFLDFNEAADYRALKASLENTLTEKELAFKLTEPEVYVSGDINAVSIATAELNAALNELLAGKNFTEIDLYQQARLDLDANVLIDPDSNREFLLEEKIVEGWVLPGHEEGQEVELSLFFMGVRDKIEFIQAMEEKEEE